MPLPRGQKITARCLARLYHPSSDSHKGDNGRLLLIAGSRQYHGSLLLSAAMATKVVDLVYVATTPENFALLQKVRARLPEFIYTPRRALEQKIAEADAVLVGPGLVPGAATARLVTRLLARFPHKKIVLDAGALRVLRPTQLNVRCVVTPHAGEFRALFKAAPTPERVRTLSQKYPGVIVLKGPVDYLAERGRLFYDTHGNSGLTKGGTGDVLAGLIAALAAKNSLLLAAQAAVLGIGLAAERLSEKFGTYYSASELIPVVQKILGRRLC